jgi:hypothetical protein
MRRQELSWIVELRMDRRYREVPIVDPVTRWNVAIAGRNQQEKRHTFTGSTVWFGDNRMSRVTHLPVLFGSIVLKFTQHARHALMGFGKIGTDGNRCLKLEPRRGNLVVFKQQIAEIDPSNWVAGVILNRLSISGTRCGTVSAGTGERADFV